jgi:DNA-binding winged helix-turn-helix (wHTH) protein
VPIGWRAFEIIEKLAQSAGQFVSKDEFVMHVWSGPVVEENTLQVHSQTVRKGGWGRTLLKNAAGRAYRPLGS